MSSASNHSRHLEQQPQSLPNKTNSTSVFEPKPITIENNLLKSINYTTEIYSSRVSCNKFLLNRETHCDVECPEGEIQNKKSATSETFFFVWCAIDEHIFMCRFAWIFILTTTKCLPIHHRQWIIEEKNVSGYQMHNDWQQKIDERESRGERAIRNNCCWCC